MAKELIDYLAFSSTKAMAFGCGHFSAKFGGHSSLNAATFELEEFSVEEISLNPSKERCRINRSLISKPCRQFPNSDAL